MGQPDEAPREASRGPVFAGPVPTRDAASSDPATPTTAEPEPAPLAPPTVPVDLSAIRTRTLGPADRALDGPRAIVEDSTRALYHRESTSSLRDQAAALAARLTQPDVGPAHARELARSLLQIRELLVTRGTPGDDPLFEQAPRWRSLADAALPAPALRTTPAGDLDGPRTSRSALARLDDAALLARAIALDVASIEPTTSPAQARDDLATITTIRDLLRQRGAPRADHLVFDRVPPQRDDPPRPHRTPGTTPRRRDTSVTAARPDPTTTTRLPVDAVPLPALPVTPVRLLRHAAATLRGGLADSGQRAQFGARTLVLPDAAIEEPGARQILDRFAHAFTGRAEAGTSLELKDRLQLLRDGWTLLDRRITADGPPTPEVVAARDSFEAAYDAQQQTLYGLATAESSRRNLRVDPTLRGLAAPTLVDASVRADIDLLLPALDTVSKGVTTLTRLQAKELGDLSKTLVDTAGIASDKFPALRFGVLSSVIFLRATLNTIKGLIAAGDLVAPGKTATVPGIAAGITVPAKLLEGLLGGMFLTLAVIHVFRNDNATALKTLAQYTTVGRGLVWTAAFGQLFSGVANLISVAVGSQEYKRSYLFDVAYGGAGTLAPIGTFGGKAVEGSIERQFGLSFARAAKLADASSEALKLRLATGGAETLAETGGRSLVDIVARRRLLTRVVGLTGIGTLIAFGADQALNITAFGREQFEKTRVGQGLTASLHDVEDVGAGISTQAVALATTSERRTPEANAAASTRLHTYMVDNLFALRARHLNDRPGDSVQTSRYPALGRRLEWIERSLRGVRPGDPTSVLTAAREVLAGMRRIFEQAPQIFREELGKLDADRFLLGRLHAEGIPPNP